MKVAYADEVTREQVEALENLVAPEFAIGIWITDPDDEPAPLLSSSDRAENIEQERQ